MTTTSHLQVKPDFYSSVDECLASERKIVNTNPRYKFFNQTHFTAADIDQFEEYRDKSNGCLSIQTTPSININLPNLYWEKYHQLDPLSVTNTFNYIFHKFKKGVFVKIKNGKLSTFLPFSKKNFTNEWSSFIKVDPKYKDITEFLQKIQASEKRKFNPKFVNKFVDTWYGNNCLLRWEYPLNEGDTNIPNLSDMLKTLAEERKLPDIEFFVNRRDFPLIKKDNTEPYDHIFGDNFTLLSHSYDKYCPILSMVGRDNYADIPIPTGEDWARVTRTEAKFFPKTATRQYTISPTSWNDKKPIAVFRGGSTGSGVTIETNPRLKVAYLSKITPRDSDGLPLLDAGITDWNLRPRKIKGEKYLQTIDIDKLPFGLVSRLTPQQQSEYKYVINIDGHVSAYRLSLELEFGSCILIADSPYKLWFRHMLEPFVHYIPVKGDLSDLIEKIIWCKQNDSKCKEIAENAVKFAKTYLTKDGILDYMQKLLFELKKINGIYIYNVISPRKILQDLELSILQKDNFYPQTNKTTEDLSIIPSYTKSYGFYKGIEWLMHMTIDQDSFYNVAEKKKEIFTNNNTTITEYYFKGIRLVEKTSNKSLVHEAFVTTQQTNNLLKRIPNFCYTFGFYDNKIITEYIEGKTLYEYIQNNFNFEEYVAILFQLCLALHVAQKYCEFVHYDLAPWNIILQESSEYITIDYPIDYNTVYRVQTKLVPIIIDMGRSHVAHNNIHHGDINMFSYSTIQDIITILNISIYEISNLQLKKDDVKKLVLLANFISRTGYRTKAFIESGKNGLGDIRYFFGKAKKYTEILTSDKKDLETKTPIDFAKYLLANFKVRNTIKIQVTNTLVHSLNQGDPRQVFDFSFCKTTKERSLTYVYVFNRLIEEELNTVDHLFEMYHLAQNIFENITSVYSQMLSYLEQNKIDNKEKFIKKYKLAIKVLDKKFKKMICGSEEDFDLDEIKGETMFTESTFLFPEKILEKIVAIDINKDITSVVNKISEIMLYKDSPYLLFEEDREYYNSLMKKLQFSKETVNLVTLCYIAKKLYRMTLNELIDKQDVSKYKIICKKILDKIKLKGVRK